MAAVGDAPEVITIAETGQAITELRKLEDGISLAPEIVLSLAKAEESGISQYVSEQVNPVVEDKISTFEGEIFLESPSLTKFVVEETCQASEDSGSQEKPNLKEKETLKSTSTLQDNQTNESIEGENIEASDKEAPVHIEGENIKTKEEKLVTSSETATEEAIESTETTDDCTVGDKVGTFMIDEQVAVDLKEENAEVANTAEFSTQENESAQVTNIHTEGLKIDNSVKEVPLSMIEERVKSSEPLAEEKLDEPVEATNSVTEGDDADTPGKEVLAVLPREHTNPEVEKQATALDSLTEEKTHESVEVPDHLQLQEGEGADNSVNEVTENVTGKNVKQEDEHLVKSLDLSSEERADESVEETDDLAETNKVDTSIPADVQREAVDLEGEQPVQSSEIFATEEADGTRSGEVETFGNEVQEGENVNAEDEQKANPTQLITEEKLDEYIEVANRPAEDEKQWENANPQDEKQAKPSESFTEEDNVEEQVQTELLPSSIPSESNIPSREESGSFDINDVANEKISQNAGEFSEIKQEAAEENQETSDVIHSDLLKTTEATHDEPTLEGIHASQSLKEEEKAINDFQTDDTEGSKSCMDLNLQLSDESPQTVEEPLGPDQEASPPATDHTEPSQERDVVFERESENKEEIIEKTREQETCNDSTFTGQNLDIKDEHIKSDSSEVCLQGELEGTSQEKPFDVAQTMSQDEGVENENPQESHVNSLAITSPDILNGGSDNTENEKKIPVTPGMEETGYHKAETEEGGEMPECTMAHSTAQGSQEITEREMNVASSLEDKLHDENIERVEAGDKEDQNQEHSQPREEPLVVKLEGAIDAVTELPETVSLSTHDEAEGNEKEATSSMDQEKSFEEESKEVQTKSGDNIEPEVPKEEVFEADNETTKQIIEDVAAVPISKDIVGEETVKESSKNNEVLSNELSGLQVCEGLEVNREREEAEKLMKDGGVNATNNSTLFAKEETTNHSFHDDEMAKNQEEAKEHKETLEIVGGEEVAEEERTQTERDETLSNAPIYIPDVSTEQVEHKETLEIVGVAAAAEEERTLTEKEETVSNASISIPDVSTEQVEHKETLEIVGEVAAEEEITQTERDETLSNASISIPDVSTEQVERKETLEIVDGEVAAEEERTLRDEILSNASISIPDVSTEQVEHKETLEIVGEVAAEEEITQTERDETLSNASISIPDVSTEQVECKETLEIVGEVAAEEEITQTERDETLSNASISIPDVSTEQVERKETLEIVGEVAAEEEITQTERDEMLSDASISIPDVSTEQVEHKETLEIVEGEVAAEEERTLRDEILSNASISIPDVSEQVEHKETLKIVGEVVAEEETTQTERDETLSNASISIPDVSTEQVEHKETLEIVEGEVAAEEERTLTERDETLSNASISIPDVSNEQVEHKETLKIVGEVAAEGETAQTERDGTLSNASISIPDVSTEQIEERDLEQDESTTRQISSCISEQEDAGEANDETKHDVQVPASALEYEVECAKNSEENKAEGEPQEISALPSKEHESKLIEENDQKKCETAMDNNTQDEEVKIPVAEQIMEDASMRKEEPTNLKEANDMLCEDIDGENQNEEFQQTQAHTEEVAVSPDVALNNPYKEVDALLISHTLDDQQTSQGVDENHGEVSDIEPGKEIQGEDGLHTDVEELQLETAEMEKSTVSANSDDGRTAEVEIAELIQTSQTECMELTNTSKGDFQSEDTHAHDDGKDEERSEEQTTIVDFHQKGIEDEKVEERIIEEDTFLKNHNEESSFESEKEQKIVEEPEPEPKEIDHSYKITDAEDRKIDAIQKDEEHDEFQTANASDNLEVIEPEINNVQDISTESVEGQTINESTGEDKKEEENPDGEVPGGLAKSETTTDREEEVIEDNCTFKDHDAQCTGEEVDKQMYPEQTRTDNDTEEEEKKEEVKESELSSAKGFRATISTEEKDTGAEDVKDSNDNPSDFNATTEASAETIQREASLKASEASIVVSAQHTDEETSEKAHDANSSSPSASVPSIEEKLSIKDDGQEDEKLVETSPHTYETHSVLEEESGTGSTIVVETEKLEETSDFNEYPTDETTIGGKSDAPEVEVEKFLPGTNATHEEIGVTSESEMTDPNEHFNENSDNVRESSKIVSNEQECEEEKILSGAHVAQEETGPTSDSLTTDSNEGFTENSENVQETSMPISKEQEQESIAMDMEIKEEAPLASEIQNENLETLLVAQPKEEIKNQVEQQENIPEGEQEVNSTSGEHEKAEKDTPDDIEDHAKSNDNLDEHEEPLMAEKPEISTELVAEDQGQAKLSIAKEVGEVAAEGGTSSIDDQMASQTLQNKGTEGENLDEAQRELAFEDRMINDTNQPIENETLVSEAIEKRSDIEMVDKHIIDEEKIPLKQVHEADIAPERNFETSESIEQNEIDTPGETHLEETRDALPVAEVSEQEVKERDCAELTEACNFSEGKEIFREGEDNAHKLDIESLTITTEKIESPEVVTEVQTILEASAMDFEEKIVEMLETNETEINVEKGTNLEITSVSHLPDEKADQKITDEKPDNYSIGSVAETQKDAQEKDEEIENKEIHEEDRRADEPNVDDENSKEEMVEAVNFDEDIETKDTEKQEIVPNEASVSNTLVEEVSERETESKCEEALYAPSEEPAKDLEYESQQLRITDINIEENGNQENEGIVPENETAIPCASGNSEDKKTDEQPEEAEPRVEAEEHQIEEIRKDNEGIQEETSTAEVSDELQTNATIENTTQEVSEVEEIVAQPCLTFSEERVNECDEEDKEQREKAHGETAKTEPKDQINEKAIDENQIEKTREATDPISYEEVQTELDITHTNDGIEQITGDEGITRDTTLVTVEEEIIQQKHQELEKNEEMIEMASGELKPEEPKTILESEKDQDMKTDLTQVEVIMNREIVEVSEEKEKADIHEEIDRSFAEEKEALEDLYQVRSDEDKAQETRQKEDLDIERVEEESSNLSSEYQNEEDNDRNINMRNEEINSSGSVVEKVDLERAGSSYETEGVTATGGESHAPPSENASEEEPKLSERFNEISKIGHEEPITEIITTGATRTGTANEDRDTQKGLAEHEQINSISELESSSAGESKDLQIKEVPTNNSDASIPEIPEVEGEITDSKEKVDFAFASEAIAEEREDNSKKKAAIEETLKTEENTQDVICENKEQGNTISTQEETPRSTEMQETPSDNVTDNALASRGADSTETTETKNSTGSMDIPLIQGEKKEEVAKMEPDDQVQTLGEESERVETTVSVEKEIIQNEHQEVEMDEEVAQMASVESSTASETIAEVGAEVIQEQHQEIEKNEETIEMVSGELKPEEPKTSLEGEKDEDTKTDETDLIRAEVIMNREIKEVYEEQERAYAHEEIDREIDRSIAEEKEASTEHHQVQSEEDKAEETHQKEVLDVERAEEEPSKLSSEYQNQEEYDRNVNARNEEINSSGSVDEAVESERAGSSYETEGVMAEGDEIHAPTSENASEEPKPSKEIEEIEHEEPVTKIITTDESAKTGTAHEATHLESSSTGESKNSQIKEDQENNSVASFPKILEAESKIIDNGEKLDLAFAGEAIAEVSQKTEEREDSSKNEAPVEETLTTEESTQETCKNEEQGNDISMQGEETTCGTEMLEKPSVDITDNTHATSEVKSTDTRETKILTRIIDVPLNRREKDQGVAAKIEPEDQVQNMATVGDEIIQKGHQEVQMNEVAQMVSVESSIANKTMEEFSQTMEEKEDNSKNEAPPERALTTQLITFENEEERRQVLQEEKTPSSIEVLENPSNDATVDGLTPAAADSITTTDTKTSAGSRSIPSNQEDQCEKASASAETIYPKHGEASEIESNAKTEECEDKPVQDVKEGVTSSKLSETENVPLSDPLRNTIEDTHEVAGTDSTEPPAKNEETEHKETPSTTVEELTEEEKDDVEENEEDEHRITDSGSDAPVMVDASRDIDVKPAPKKSHNLLSGMGSKVKHSIAKVKKAITGKSTHHKQSSPK